MLDSILALRVCEIVAQSGYGFRVENDIVETGRLSVYASASLTTLDERAEVYYNLCSITDAPDGAVLCTRWSLSSPGNLVMHVPITEAAINAARVRNNGTLLNTLA